MIIKPVVWIGPSKEDLKSLPEAVQDVFGYALYLAQTGKKHPEAKPLHGFGGASVLEVVEDYRSKSKPCSCCTYFKRNQNTVSPRRRRTWT